MKTSKAKGQRLPRAYRRAAILVLLAVACGGTVTKGPSVGSESHFLAHCESRCEGGLDCIGGICTRSCLTQEASCSDLAANAACTNQSVEPGQVAICDVSCAAGTGCGALGADYACEGGYCRQSRSGTDGAGGGPASGGSAGNGSAAGTTGLSGTAGSSTAGTGSGTLEDCEPFRDQSPPPDVRAISITNSGSVPLYILPERPSCLHTTSLVQVERDGQPVDVIPPPDCRLSCQRLIDEGWSYTPGSAVPLCPNATCPEPSPVLIGAGQTLLQPATLELVEQQLPRGCAQGLTADSESCYTRVIPQPGSYTLTLRAALEPSGTPLVFSFPSPWYFQDQELQIAAPAN